MSRILVVSLTERGRFLAGRLPYERSHGDLAATVRERWGDVDGFVLMAAVGACVRIVAPLLAGKDTDPAVVCVDDAGQFAVALLGGHAAGANDLAREVAELLGAAPVVTTATDATGTIAIDRLPGFVAEGDVAAVTAALLDGRHVSVDNSLGWPLPDVLSRRLGDEKAGATIVLSDEVAAPSGPGIALLRPPSLVAGIGASTAPPADEIADLLAEALAEAGLSRSSLHCVATIDRRAGEPGITSLGLPVVSYSSDQLAHVDVPNPSAVVQAAVGTASVAEAAALLAAGRGATLLVAKTASAHATVAIARSARPLGQVTVIGLGPGGPATRTPEADRALRSAQVVIGYEAYIAQCRDLLGPSQDVVMSPIGSEVERARDAVARAALGATVAVVCSGDPGVYAMASLVFEESADTAVTVTVVPGVTAALAAAAALGAPLGHDHLVLSLSDLLTPWDVIVRRVIAARDSDLVIALYNPRSKARDWQLGAVRDLLLERRAPHTPVGIATDVGRPGGSTSITTLAELDPELVGMTTCVIIGSSSTRVIGGRMVTPRGYRRHRPAEDPA